MKALDPGRGYVGEVFPEKRLERGIPLLVEELERVGDEVGVVADLPDGIDRGDLGVEDVHIESIGLDIEERPHLAEPAKLADRLDHRRAAPDEDPHRPERGE